MFKLVFHTKTTNKGSFEMEIISTVKRVIDIVKFKINKPLLCFNSALTVLLLES